MAKSTTIDSVYNKSSGGAGSHQELVEARMAEVRECLRQHELIPGSKIWLALGEHKTLILCLAKALSDLGLVFRYFVRYLSHRPDLIAADDCLILDSALSSPPPLGDVRVERMLSSRIEEFAGLPKENEEESSEPCRRLSVRTCDRLLRLELRDDEFLDAWATDQRCLAPLAPVIERIWPHVAADQLTAEFQNETAEEMDFPRRLEWLTSASKSDELFISEGMVTPVADVEFSTEDCIALRELASETIGQSIFELQRTAARGRRGSSVADFGHRHIARNLCLSWLNQAFLGDWFPYSPRESVLSLGRGGREVYFHGGATGCLSNDTQMLLLNYVMATASGSPDDAAEFLAEILEPGNDCKGLEFLKRRMRQIVPFRDGGWYENGQKDLLADHLFLQWRAAKDSGYRACEQVANFHRGMLATALLAVRLAPKTDILKDAMYEFRMKKAVADLVEHGKLSNVVTQAEKAMELFVDFAQKFDRIVESNSPRKRRAEEATRSNGSKRHSLRYFAALYLALLGLAAASNAVSSKLEGLMGAAFLLISLALLYGITRSK